jgi:hypothetical protein
MNNEEVIIESLVFRDRFVEVSYRPVNAESNGITKIQTFGVPTDALPQHYSDLIEAAQDFVSEAEVTWRNPPSRIPSHRESEDD